MFYKVHIQPIQNIVQVLFFDGGEKMNRVTEERNINSMNIDRKSTVEIINIINSEDKKVAQALSQDMVQSNIARVIEAVVHQFKSGGRLFYVGAGTSGRLGVLDAAECVPTFGTDPEMVQGIIAGGPTAMTEAIEGAEDSPVLGEQDLRQKSLSSKDFVLGIAASGSTPYVIGALEYARRVGAKTGALSCNHHAKISQYADIAIEVIVGPEVVTGSTRMKAGTAQKMVLNTISTTAMIKIGKVFGNLMVDVKPTNNKLVDRAKRIISEATGLSYDQANDLYLKSGHSPKIAIVMALLEVSASRAKELLEQENGQISDVLRHDR